MRLRLTRVVYERLREKGLEPFVDSCIIDTQPSVETSISLVDECHYVVEELLPEDVPCTSEEDMSEFFKHCLIKNI